MLGKVVNGNLVYAPRKVDYEGRTIFNPTSEVLKELGYKEIERSEPPVITFAQYLTERYVVGDKIYVGYKINDIDYDELVNAEIRQRYSESQEFAILRQRDTKPQEYKEYFNYCEECKRTIKEEMGVK